MTERATRGGRVVLRGAVGVLALLLGALAQEAAAQSGDTGARLDEYVRAYHELGDFSGCVRVTRADATLLRKCYGKASYELGVPNSFDTRFRIGSLSKQFTAAAILVLEQRGLLRVDDALSAHVSGFPRGDDITIYHLLTHTSGLRNSFGLPGYETLKRRGATLVELVDTIRAVPLDFEPGSQYAYGNSGYIVLARVIESVSGQSYADFLRSAIFEPAGMLDSGVDEAQMILPNRAAGHTPAGLAGRDKAPAVDPSVEIGAGNLYSTIDDLGRWHDALYSDRILSDSSRVRMLSRQEGYYGFGMAVYDEHDRPIHAHDGRVSGFSSDISRYPEDSVSVIVLSNLESGIGDSFRRDLGAIVFGIHYELPAARAAVEDPPTAEQLEAYAGQYEFGPGFIVTARVTRGRLYVAANAGEFSELTPLRDGTFLNRMTYARVRFERDADGTIRTMVWMQDGNEFPGSRFSPAPAAQVETVAPTAGISIERAEWLTGCWRMDVGMFVMEEQWMAPAGGAMLGMNRALRDGEFRSYELLILEVRDGRLVYEAHPSGQSPAEFTSTVLTDSLLVFENPAHDFPQKLVYIRSGADSLLARVFGAAADEAPAFEVPFARVACAGTAIPATGDAEARVLRGAANYITAHPAVPREGAANAVIEIPAGTNAKWEVVEPGSTLEWEIEEGRPRVVGYLPYPANYGMIPRTRLPKALGGDGDPLDVIVLGPALPRGAVVTVTPVAVLRLLDDGERDDKIVAVRAAGPLSEVDTLEELETRYPGVTEILRIWFTSYKGPGRLESPGWGDEVTAMAVIQEAAELFEQAGHP